LIDPVAHAGLLRGDGYRRAVLADAVSGRNLVAVGVGRRGTDRRKFGRRVDRIVAVTAEHVFEETDGFVHDGIVLLPRTCRQDIISLPRCVVRQGIVSMLRLITCRCVIAL
ncbi:hypothetical protein DN545_40535, partial [Burkholderia multivorans]